MNELQIKGGAIEALPRGRGRPSKYPDFDLKVGGSASFRSADIDKLRLLRMSILNKASRRGELLETVIQDNELKIKRVA